MDLEELKLIRKGLGILVKGVRVEECPPPVQTVDEFVVDERIRSYLHEQHIVKPSVVQMQTWPAAVQGRDLLSIAPTGSGKTLAYVIPLVQHILNIRSNIKSKPKKSANNTSSSAAVNRFPLVLIVVPTRELCSQVDASMKRLRKLVDITTCCLYGGHDKDDQLRNYRVNHGADVLVCTPGRLLDCAKTKQIDLSHVSYLVLDEADRMLALGFEEQLNDIFTFLSSQRQTLLFSASFPGKLRDAASKWMRDELVIRCSTIEVASAPTTNKNDKEKDKEKDNKHEKEREKENKKKRSNDNDNENDNGDNNGKDESEDVGAVSTKKSKHIHDNKESDNQQPPTTETTTSSSSASAIALSSSVAISPTVVQHVHVCATHKKPRLLIHFIEKVRETEKLQKARQPAAMLVFCTKIKTVKFVLDFLQRHEMKTGVAMLHGGMAQAVREKALDDFRAGKLNILISTDVCARGIHIKRLKYVINYDFPVTLEQYCHRIGRVGRQGAEGEAYSLITRNMVAMVPALIKLLEACQQAVEPNLKALGEELLVEDVDGTNNEESNNESENEMDEGGNDEEEEE